MIEVEWLSKKGRQRNFNNDAVAVSCVDGFLVAIIVDAAEKILNGRVLYGENDQGKRLANYWAETCLSAIIDNDLLLDRFRFFEVLSAQHKKLKFDYLHDVAYYGVLIVDTKNNSADWYYVGDCLIGQEGQDNRVSWLHSPDRANELFEPSLESVSKHVITKSLNAKRFDYPDHLALDSVNNMGDLILATDGYWCEHLQDGVAMSDLEDDCSVLKIKYGNKIFRAKTDTPNFFVCGY